MTDENFNNQGQELTQAEESGASSSSSSAPPAKKSKYKPTGRPVGRPQSIPRIHEDEPLKKLMIEIPADIHLRFKVHAAATGTTMGGLLREYIEAVVGGPGTTLEEMASRQFQNWFDQYRRLPGVGLQDALAVYRKSLVAWESQLGENQHQNQHQHIK